MSEAGQLGISAETSSRANFSQVFAVREFRALWAAQVLSVAGDQLARVALTLLVFDRTRSALLAAVTFAASVVPSFIGGIALAGIADRLPRRGVMIGCDLISATLVGLMALPGMPLGLLVALLFIVTMVSAPFLSARAALYPDVLPGDLYVLGTAVTLTTMQVAQVVGFAAAGAVVAGFGSRTSLVADAGTFLASALLIRLYVRTRPGARPGSGAGFVAAITIGTRRVFTDSSLRTPMLFGWLAAFLDVHEGVVAPLAASLGGGAVAVGFILASGAFGTSAGAIGFTRLMSAQRRETWVPPLSIASCGVLALFALRPPLPWALAILVLSGVLSCYQVAANASFVRAAPPQERSRAFGVAQAGMSLGQGSAMILAGAAAEHFAASDVIAASGVLGAIVATIVAMSARPKM